MPKTFLCLLFLLLSAASQASSEKCQSGAISVTKRIEISKLQLEGVNTLLGEGENFRQPLDVLFLVDLADDELIERRKKEISVQLSKNEILASTEFQELLRCNEEKADVELFAEVTSNLNLARKKFYDLPTEKREALVESYSQARSRQADTRELNQEIEKYQDQLKSAQSDISKSEVKSTETLSPALESIVVAKTALETFRSDIATDQIRFLEKIRSKEIVLDQLHGKLRETFETSEKLPATLPELLEKSIDVWLSSVEEMRELFSDISFSASLSLPPLASHSKELNQEERSQLEAYRKDYEELLKKNALLLQSRTERLNALKAKGFLLLSEAGQRRSSLLAECDETGSCPGHRKLNSRNLLAMYREITVLPLKIKSWAIAKYLEVKGKFNAGFDGWMDLGHQLLALILFIMLPIFFYRSLFWIKEKLNLFRKSLLAKSMLDFRRRTFYATWISRLAPFVPTAGMALGLIVLRRVIEGTDFVELSGILFYLQLYYVYRIFRLITKILFSAVFSSESVAEMRERKQLAEQSSRRISRIIFLEYAFLHLIESSVRRALVYGIISSFIFELNVLLLFWETHRWRDPLREAVRERFPKFKWLHERLEKSRLFSFLAGPVLLFLAGGYDFIMFIYRVLIRFDLFKRLSSEYLRRRLEEDSVREERLLPPKEYLTSFDYYLPASGGIFVEIEDSVSKTALRMITQWKSGSSALDLLVIVGNRGMGKTTALNAIGTSLKPACVVQRVSPKVLTSVNLYSWLSEVTGSTLRSPEDLMIFDRSLKEKTVLVIDDIQNLFLANIEGFEAYKTFIDLLGLRTKNIFWCLSVNSRSWSYLKGVFGKEHIYGEVISLAPWRESEIQQLILSRHGTSGYTRKFDPSIKAYGAGSDVLGQQTETQFFRLLWGQSRGNPRSALMYWISAITQQGDKGVLVGVPSFISADSVSSLSDEAHFILASIARHDSLSVEEIMQSTSIPSPVVRKCVTEAMELQLIWEDELKRFRISSRAQYVIDYFLLGKNFLYE